jgi:hypothetical protein
MFSKGYTLFCSLKLAILFWQSFHHTVDKRYSDIQVSRVIIWHKKKGSSKSIFSTDKKKMELS